MMRTLYVSLAFALLAVSAVARAAGPPGLYVGASLGAADIRSTDVPLTFAGTDFGWEIFVGARPLSFAGVELTYMDFGHATAPLPPPNFAVTFFGDNLKQRAAAAFGMGYVPLPVPLWELYGKLGIARLDARAQVESVIGFYDGSRNVSQNQWNTDFAYGAGVQAKFGRLSLRAEYERICDTRGDPALSAVGVLWSF